MRTFLLLFAVWISNSVYGDCGESASLDEIRNSGKHTVTGPLAVFQLEEQHMVEIRETGEFVPFGYVNNEWERLKLMMQEGDTIYHVEYREGRFRTTEHVLLHKGCIVFWIRESIT